MTAELIGWLDEHSLDHRRRMRNAMWVSLAVHGVVIALFAVSPPAQFASLPEVLAVELVAAAPSGPSVPRAQPTPPSTETAPQEPVAPPPTPEPPAPVAKAPVQVLPEEAPGRIRKAVPKVEPKRSPESKPEPKAVPWRPKREKSLSYEDAMAALDDDLGVDETADLLTPAPTRDDDSDAEATSEATQARSGAEISPELAAWNLKVRRLIQNKWVMPSIYRDRGLATSLEIRLSASGDLIGKPVVTRSSGDPFFDDNAVSALLKVAPLPPVTEPGRRIFIFRSEEN